LLPFDQSGNVDWDALGTHIHRTLDSGLMPAVNMDTGYANLIDESMRLKVLSVCRDIAAAQPFIAGCFVADDPGARFDLDKYSIAIEQAQNFGGTPIIFQSYGLTDGDDAEIVENYARIAQQSDQFYAFELGKMFAHFGEIYSLELFRQLLDLKACIGAKHSSLNREAEWDRLALRDEVRPEFEVLTGNDLAIDMVMYGSDYLLGLSTFAPDLFAKRDRYWATGDPAFYELNDKLQYLGFFAFRQPTSAYKHTAAQFLHLRNWIATSKTHPASPRRPDSDVTILEEITKQLGIGATANG
jgi:dihydrodipicolinate synthase/N-acetylneuraminate lyase